MSTATRAAAHPPHVLWAAFVTVEVLVVAVTLALDFTVAGFVMVGLAMLSLRVHRHGFTRWPFHHRPQT